LGGCAWRRCAHPAAAVVAFALPHPLAGTKRGYCAVHAEHVAAQPGASLAVAAGVAVQPALPGLNATGGATAGGGAAGASTAGQGPPWAGGRQ
jgi:hypothetical protein